MKTFASLIAVAVVVAVLSSISTHQKNAAAARENLVVSNKIALLMTREEVQRSLGKPLSTSLDKFGRETWHYPEGLAVDFTNGKMIGTRTDQIAPPPQSSASRKWTYVPALGRYIEHDSNVSAMQSIGMSRPGPAPTPVPSSSDTTIKKAWGFAPTALDKPAGR